MVKVRLIADSSGRFSNQVAESARDAGDGPCADEAGAFGPLPAMQGFDPSLERAAPDSLVIRGVHVRKGSRVLLHPHPGGDILDLALAGRIARVEAIEQDYEDTIHVAVTVDDDPGRDLGDDRQPGHRFFFSPDEVEPLDGTGDDRR